MGDIPENTLIFTDTDDGGIVHIANIKGGVGKSTVATNLAAAFSQRGPTLLIDLDVQGSATVAFGREINENDRSSWELLRRRYSAPHVGTIPENFITQLRSAAELVEKKAFAPFIGCGSITSLVVPVHSGLDLIPAGPGLYKTVSALQLGNLRFNLSVCRDYYKYIIIDTPSVWNGLTRLLYLSSDLNLVPVTLNALSTKSLRDYLYNVRNLSRRYPRTRFRIVKNEVFGKQDSKLMGKTRTMNENRRFLENLCEQVAFTGSSGVSILPQSIIFDLEIPESAVVRNAQDEGMTIYQYQQYGKVNKAFDELAKRVQFVLNSGHPENESPSVISRIESAAIALAAILVMAILFLQKPIAPGVAPRPVAPQQLAIPSGGVFVHTFSHGESIHRLAKYAICRFRATVPSWKEINDYIDEVVSIHNLTRRAGEEKISKYTIAAGTKVAFYPPATIHNELERQLAPVYSYFIKTVDDPFAYVTGDWCERGTGGGQPHYGLDIAANLGSRVIAPIGGIALQITNEGAGRTLGIVNNGTVLFFCHLDKRFFKDGDIVKPGQVIGTVGLTGRTSGPHAHIGYGIKSQSRGDMKFGKSTYRITDPKLFFYRQMYMEQLASK